jgi:hypothetical protein
VLLFTSSLDTQWNNLPRQGLYVPLMHEMFRYLALQEDKKQSYTVGEPVRLIIPPGSAVRVIEPQGTETILTSIAADEVFYSKTLAPGFYGIRGPDIHDFLAVNVAPLESDLAFAAPAEVGDRLVSGDPRPPPPRKTAVSSIDARQETIQRLWWWILLFVLLIGLGETLLANRTYR